MRLSIRDTDAGKVPGLLEKQPLTYEKVSFRFKRSRRVVITP